MKISICSMNIHYRFYDLNYFFESCTANEIKYIELWLCPQHIYLDDDGWIQDLSEIKDIVKEKRLTICCICPEQNNPKPYNMAARSPFLIEKSMNYFKRVVDIAYEFQTEKILLTGGWAYFDEDVEVAWKRSVTHMKIIADYANTKGIDIVVEPLQPHESRIVNTLSKMKKYLMDVDKKNLFVAIDIGAIAKANETVEEWFAVFGNKIKHIHFVDGNPTGHLPIGKGTRNIDEDLKVLKKENYNGALSFEFASSISFENPCQMDKESKIKITDALNKIMKGGEVK